MSFKTFSDVKFFPLIFWYILVQVKEKNLFTQFLTKMKKNVFALLSVATIIIAWCNNSSITKIDSENRTSKEWLSAEQTFKKQIEKTQYIKDLEDFLSYDILLNTENKPFSSKFILDADFDEDSSVRGWLTFSQEKIFKSNDLESFDIAFNLEAEDDQKKESIYSSWDIVLLYQDNEMYANLRDFWIFMWEWNMSAKMYELLWNMIKGRWVDLEVDNWGIISTNRDEDRKLPYAILTLKYILETEEIQSSPNFLNSVVEMIDTLNSHIDLWISTNELTLLSHEIEYSQLSDGSIQKIFTWDFQWKDSSFALAFTATKKKLDVRLYDIKEYDEDINSFKDTDSEYFLSIQANKKSDYSITFQSTKYHQNVVDLNWKIKYWDVVDLTADFVLEPIEVMKWQKISWNLKWSIERQWLRGDENFPELSWEIVSISDILDSL